MSFHRMTQSARVGIDPPAVLPDPIDGKCQAVGGCARDFYMRGVDLDGRRQALCVPHFVQRAHRNAPSIRPTAHEEVEA